MKSIFKREFKSYFTNMAGFLFLATLLLFAGIFTSIINLRGLIPDFGATAGNIVIVFLLIIPVLAMKSIAEDKKMKTDNLLYSLPVSMTKIILGKYFAMICVLVIAIVVMAFYPMILSSFGTVSLPSAFVALLGLLLLGASLISVCMFMSSLTESQVIAAVTGFGVTLLLYFINAVAALVPSTPSASLWVLIILEILLAVVCYVTTKNRIMALCVGGAFVAFTVIFYLIDKAPFTGLLIKICQFLAVFDKVTPFENGILDLTTVVYYLTFSGFFVFLTVMSMEKKRFA